MKLQIVSDTHEDLSRFIPNKFADLIVHAGDFTSGSIASIKPIEDFVNLCSDYNKECVFVLGNHDYYGHNFYNNPIEKECLKRNYNLLNKENTFEYQGFKFVGNIFGTDFQLPGEYYQNTDLIKFYSKRSVNDFYSIYTDDSLSTLLLPEDYIKEFNASLDLLNTYRNQENIVVVTHFPLSEQCLDPRYTNNILNPYFINNIDLTGFKTIISGHTHTTMTKKVNNTDIYINAYGYSNGYKYECHMFDTNFIIDL